MSLLLPLVELLRPHQTDLSLVQKIIDATYGHSLAELISVRRAHSFADATHAGQFRKDGQPYVTHPIAAFVIHAVWGGRHNADEAAAIFMHDGPEDHPKLWSLEKMRHEFNDRVAESTHCCNRRRFDHIADKREADREFLLHLLESGSSEACITKLAERLHNGLTSNPDDLKDPDWKTRKLIDLRYIYIPLARRHQFLYREMIELAVVLEQGQVLLPPP